MAVVIATQALQVLRLLAILSKVHIKLRLFIFILSLPLILLPVTGGNVSIPRMGLIILLPQFLAKEYVLRRRPSLKTLVAPLAIPATAQVTYIMVPTPSTVARVMNIGEKPITLV